MVQREDRCYGPVTAPADYSGPNGEGAAALGHLPLSKRQENKDKPRPQEQPCTLHVQGASIVGKQSSEPRGMKT